MDFRLSRRILFLSILEGKKKFEGRSNKSKYKVLKVGTIVNIRNSNNIDYSFNVVITSLTEYDTFEDMLEDKGLQNVLPGERTIEQEIKNVYRRWYNEECEKEYGVLAIGIKPIIDLVYSPN